MPQRGDHLRFMAKAPHKIRAGKRAVQKHFQRDDAVQAQLPRPINHAHAAARNFLQQFVIPQPQQPAPAPDRRIPKKNPAAPDISGTARQRRQRTSRS